MVVQPKEIVKSAMLGETVFGELHVPVEGSSSFWLEFGRWQARKRAK